MDQYRIGLYEKAMPGTLSWKEKLECVKALGFDYLEMSIDETDEKLARLEWSADERELLRRTMKDVGVPIGSMCLSGHRKYPLGSHDQQTRQRSMDIMEKAIRFAAELGIRTIQLAGYDVYYEDGDDFTREQFSKNLKAAVMLAASEGVVLGFETMETEFMNTVKKSMVYVDTIQSQYLGVYPDLGNLTNAAVAYGSDLMEDLAEGAGSLVAMHLKETVPGVFREVRFGTGHVNFEKGIGRAWELGVRRFVIEMWYKGSPAWREDIADAVKMMRRHLDRRS